MPGGFVPPKVTGTRTAQDEALHKVGEKTATGARRIVATFAGDFCGAVTLMCILGAEKEGLSFKKIHEEYERENAPKTAKRACRSIKKTAKKLAKRSAKESIRRTAKRAVKKAAEKTAKKVTKKTTRRATN